MARKASSSNRPVADALVYIRNENITSAAAYKTAGGTTIATISTWSVLAVEESEGKTIRSISPRIAGHYNAISWAKALNMSVAARGGGKFLLEQHSLPSICIRGIAEGIYFSRPRHRGVLYHGRLARCHSIEISVAQSLGTIMPAPPRNRCSAHGLMIHRLASRQ